MKLQLDFRGPNGLSAVKERPVITNISTGTGSSLWEQVEVSTAPTTGDIGYFYHPADDPSYLYFFLNGDRWKAVLDNPAVVGPYLSLGFSLLGS